MYKHYKESNCGNKNINMQENLQASMSIDHGCGCQKPDNSCEECYKYENMANHKRKHAMQLQEQARKMQMEADALIREAHMLMCKAEECFKHCNKGPVCNYVHGNYNNGCHHEHECDPHKDKCKCGCKYEWECTCKPKKNC